MPSISKEKNERFKACKYETFMNNDKNIKLENGRIL
jgi:hypothetical protein